MELARNQAKKSKNKNKTKDHKLDNEYVFLYFHFIYSK